MERMIEESLSKSFGDSSEGIKNVANVGIVNPGKKKVLLSPPHTKGSEKVSSTSLYSGISCYTIQRYYIFLH